jgi:hypothetical protein
MHHIMGISGVLLGNYVGGFLGSLGQISWITEASTPFVNLRAIMSYHKLQKHPFYMVIALGMTLSFFVFRICYYYYMIFN